MRSSEIPWDVPLPIVVPGKGKWFVCRVCVARYGLKAATIQDTSYAFATRQEAYAHLTEDHPEIES